MDLFTKRAQENYKKKLKELRKKPPAFGKNDDVVLDELKKSRKFVKMINHVKRGREKDIAELF
jgi:hypothetical protein